ncbi:MAG: ABC transporter permease [Parcubacteria group bacterium]
MNKSIIAIKNITFSAIKMFFRDKQAIFFSLFLPVMIMVIFGFMDFDKMSAVKLSIADEAGNEASGKFVESIEKADVFEISTGSVADEKKLLEAGDRDLLLILPESFGVTKKLDTSGLPANYQKIAAEMGTEIPATSGPLNIELFYNEGEQEKVAIGTSILKEIFHQYEQGITNSQSLFFLESKPVTSRNLTFVDFLIPGIVAMSIMQMGVIGVAASIVSWREKGILRRLLATPVKPFTIIFSQVLTRLIISVLQTTIIVTLGVVFFDLQLIGSPLLVLLLAFLGGIIFLSVGFTISGFGKTHNTVMALSNIIMMPMMFLSGVFFSRDVLPDWLKTITEYLPLTYLADAIRAVMIDGSGLLDVGGEIIGLLVWMVIAFALATKFFKWE